jgi:tetratricopeptide (TPR) repeat protein
MNGVYVVSEMLRCGVSLFPSVFSKEDKRYTLGVVLKNFASRRYAKTVREARGYLREGDTDMYKACKSMLPVVAFCGVFEGGHSKTNLVHYNNIVIIDIDHLSEEALSTVTQQLQQDEYVFAYWKSPSGQGLKGLVRISSGDEKRLDDHHLQAFHQLTDYFKTKYSIDIDQSGSDDSRLCYACWDEGLVLKEMAKVFEVNEEKEFPVKNDTRILAGNSSLEMLKRTRKASRQSDIDTVKYIIHYLQDTGRSITYEYENWMRVAYAIAATFTPKTGLSLFLQLSQQDTEKYDEEACRRMLDYCYAHTNGQITLGTIVYLARKAGYNMPEKPLQKEKHTKMTVKEVFDLRKQGKIEEAYEAIRPMYAVHQGKYTTLCMFWTAHDILKFRLQTKRLDEAEKIFKALLRILPNIEDKDGGARKSMLHYALVLGKESKSFSVLEYVGQLKVEQFTDDDWKTITETAEGVALSHPIPPDVRQLLTHAFHELQENSTPENAQKMMPLLQEALRRNPRDKHCQRYQAVAYRTLGEKEKAIDTYRQMLRRAHDSYLYAELAELTDDPGQKAALYCQAIQHQRQEKFRTGYRLALARLLMDCDKPRAAYELQKCVAIRKASGYHPTREIQQILKKLDGVKPATDAAQRDFYRKMAEKYKA